MQHPLEHFAIAVSAITGALAARGKQVDLFGVLVLALVTSFGGGTVRDVVLGDFPVEWARSPAFVATAALAALATFFIARTRELPVKALEVADAFGLALFTIVGVKKALLWKLDPSIAVTLGVATGVAGGILRDVLTGEIPLVFRPAIRLYATAALVGAALYVLLSRAWPGAYAVTVASVVCILVLRLAAIRWNLALPVFHPPRGG